MRNESAEASFHREILRGDVMEFRKGIEANMTLRVQRNSVAIAVPVADCRAALGSNTKRRTVLDALKQQSWLFVCSGSIDRSINAVP
jgi:hypothetical protein